MKAFPLQWPSGWKRTSRRTNAKFNQRVKSYSSEVLHYYKGTVTISAGTQRVLKQLSMLEVVEGDAIISTNLKLRLDGLPYVYQKEPTDPGVAVYWRTRGETVHKVMAVDRYERVADNLAALAATLEAMRAIERHGGAVILERAFTGFLALPAPNTWRAVLGFSEDDRVTLQQAKTAYRVEAGKYHPDKLDVGLGDPSKMTELNWAWAEAQKELG